MTLSTILNDTAAMLNDQNYSFNSQSQLTRWVNEARKQLAKRTGCTRRLITGQSAFGASAQPGFAIPGAMQPGALPNAYPQSGNPSFSGSSGSGSDFNSDFNADYGPQSSSGRRPSNVFWGPGQDFNPDFNADFGGSSSGTGGVVGAVLNRVMTIPGVERYPYEGFWNPALRAAYEGCDKVIDAIALSVNWGGVTRPTLDWMPWDNLQAYARAYAALNMSYPSVWSVYNDGPQGEIWMFPIPSQANEMELDATVTPKDIYNDSDYDIIPDGFQEALKFGAAKLAFLARARYAQAQVMEDVFADNIGVARVAVDRGKTSSYYWTVP